MRDVNRNYAVDHFFPEFKMWEQFVYSDLNSAFELDALASSHPIEVPVGHASEVDESQLFSPLRQQCACPWKGVRRGAQ